VDHGVKVVSFLRRWCCIPEGIDSQAPFGLREALYDYGRRKVRGLGAATFFLSFLLNNSNFLPPLFLQPIDLRLNT
jgi:hypothetical protein